MDSLRWFGAVSVGLGTTGPKLGTSDSDEHMNSRRSCKTEMGVERNREMPCIFRTFQAVASSERRVCRFLLCLELHTDRSNPENLIYDSL